jgi:hypothetical protein
MMLQVREWVLAASLDPAISHAASQRTCAACSQATFEANLACHACGARCEMCMVTGELHLSHQKTLQRLTLNMRQGVKFMPEVENRLACAGYPIAAEDRLCLLVGSTQILSSLAAWDQYVGRFRSCPVTHTSQEPILTE